MSYFYIIKITDFYPRSPCGERRWNSTERPEESHFYPRSPCGERLVKKTITFYPPAISIHALLAESDHAPNRHPCPRSISIHALLAESDWALQAGSTARRPFLSTLSLRRATGYVRYCTHTPGISIHALLAESDYILCAVSGQVGGFLSTLSLRRATSVLWMVPSHPLFLSTLSLRRATLNGFAMR